ncbi:hypothetical protein AGMMS49983_04770 [Clostridia bacterium]|nr:hypothetical protein AGMMS49983_04770 [Clostridia bacterium]
MVITLKNWNSENTGRITILVGHFGSGKTEVALNMAIALKESGAEKMALADLDIANVYFRSREQKTLLDEKGIELYSNAYGYDITSDLPALPASLRAPLEDKSFRLVIDAGGNESGARVLNQYGTFLRQEDVSVLIVVNVNRPETDSVSKAEAHLRAIEAETGLPTSGILSNTHMLKETTPADIFRGIELCRSLSKNTNIPFVGSTCLRSLLSELESKSERDENSLVFPIDLYMRPTWIDR